MMQTKSKKFLHRVILLSAVFLLTGCAVMDKKDCVSANWYDLGRMDALSGQYRLSSRAEACAEHGLGTDKPAYERGVQEGLLGFCTAASGRSHGEKGGSYSRGFCPSHTEAAFLSGYTPAEKKYQFRKKIKELQSQLDNKNRLLSDELNKKNRNDREIERLRSDVSRLQSNMQMEMYMRILD